MPFLGEGHKMRNAFLLRYQEFCLADETPDACSGTKTDTRIRAEQSSDEDPGTGTLAVLPNTSRSDGAIGAQEQDWSEPKSGIFAGTRTRTKVLGEKNGDEDPRQTSLLTIPKCS
jgi:hypothetical protein